MSQEEQGQASPVYPDRCPRLCKTCLKRKNLPWGGWQAHMHPQSPAGVGLVAPERAGTATLLLTRAGFHGTARIPMSLWVHKS